jgi:hypothetical protein
VLLPDFAGAAVGGTKAATAPSAAAPQVLQIGSLEVNAAPHFAQLLAMIFSLPLHDSPEPSKRFPDCQTLYLIMLVSGTVFVSIKLITGGYKRQRTTSVVP